MAGKIAAAVAIGILMATVFGIYLGRAPAAPAASRETIPLGLPPLPPAPTTPAVVDLGKKLFFDRRLSFNSTMSCGMCHIEGQAFAANQLATSVGMEGKSLRRNAPSLLNVAYEHSLFRDGRENALNTQIWSPITAQDEMAAPSVGWELNRIRSLPNYTELFAQAFPGQGVSMETIGSAISAYERTLLLGNSRFDRWRYGGDANAVTAQEKAGFDLFTHKAGCVSCHTVGETSALFTDHQFHDTGNAYANTMGIEPDAFDVRLAEGNITRRTRKDVASITSPSPNDLGRFEVTQDPADRWTFKTPSLRNVALTAPYMHDGSMPTLETIVDYYDAGGNFSPNKDERIKPLHLTVDEKAALVAFLKTLTGAKQNVN